MYHQTVLKGMTGIFLDGGGRHFSPCQLLDGFSTGPYGSWNVTYRYWIKGTLDYVVHEFYLRRDNAEAMWTENRLLENVLIFNDENEYNNFKQYAANKWNNTSTIRAEIRDPYIEPVKGRNMDVYKIVIIDVAVLQELLKDYRYQKNTVDGEW